ncbi:hypothetical protein PLCT2_01801 [Planctomycetaceae bacterium]|nr:hypothetical protein PLCT2_01801 [Planctomycetaceae bacterium]
MKLLFQLAIAGLVILASHTTSIQSERQEALAAPAVPEPAKSKDPAEGALKISDAIVDGIANERFTVFYDFMPNWMASAAAKASEVRKWRMKEGWDRWKDLKARFEGDAGLDPKDRSGITSSEEMWIAASDAERGAVMLGLYRVYACDDWEKRVNEGEWFLDNRTLKLDVEGQGSAKFRYQNKYNDGLTVHCVREAGVWYCAGVELKMEKKMPEKPKD